MTEQLQTIGANVLSNIFNITPASLAGPGFSAAIRTLLDRRQQIAFDILLEEIASGNVNRADVPAESLAAPVYRYLRAAREGSARLNLRLLAQVISGKASTQTLIADEFLYLADTIASLRREEIILIATMQRLAENVSVEDPASRILKIWNKTVLELAPIFGTEAHVAAVAQSASRTGLVLITWSWQIHYFISPLAQELTALAPFEAALEREPNE